MKTIQKLIAVLMTVVVISLGLIQTVSAKIFNDVPESAPYFQAVSRLSDLGIIAGRGDGMFDPDTKTTRAEFCAFLARANGYFDNFPGSSVPFRDVPDTYWAVNVISYCYQNGYINGMGDGTFEPARTITYEEAIKMIVCAAKLGDISLTEEGPYWYSGFLRVAQENNLLENTDFQIGEPTPRHFVAQVIYNGLDYFQTTPVPTITPKPTASVSSTPSSSPTPTPTPTPTKKPVAYNTIVIDAGHNDRTVDTGAEGNGFREQDITFEIASRVKPILERYGLKVIMTREKKTDVLGTTTVESLQERVDIANENNAELFVSIHLNSGGGRGTETYCWLKGGNAEILAEYVQAAIVEETGFYDRKVKTGNLYVLKNTDMPAILVETGFIDNEKDAAFLGSEEGQQAMAEAIAKGILRYKGLIS